MQPLPKSYFCGMYNDKSAALKFFSLGCDGYK